MQCSEFTGLRLVPQVLPARRSDDRRRLRTMSQRTELFTVRDLALVVPVLGIELYELGMIGNLRQLGHHRKRVALGALFTWFPIVFVFKFELFSYSPFK